MARPKSLTLTVNPEALRKTLEGFTALNTSSRKKGEGFQTTELDRLTTHIAGRVSDFVGIDDRPPAPPVPMWVSWDRSDDEVSLFVKKADAPRAWMAKHSIAQRTVTKIKKDGKLAYSYSKQIGLGQFIELIVVREDLLDVFLTGEDLENVTSKVEQVKAEAATSEQEEADEKAS